MKDLIEEIKNKKQFSELPDFVVERALEKSGGDVKEARALLRKYFGVFLVNKVFKGVDEKILQSHISSKDRCYDFLYKKIFETVDAVGSVVDLGAGVNGFSYGFFPEDIVYVGVEAVGQLVRITNNYFKDRGFEKAHVFHKDLFDLNFVLDILQKLEKDKPRVVFMFQVFDALEFFERDFSKKLLLEISRESEFIVLSFALKSLSGKKKFDVNRRRLLDFLEKNFEILNNLQTRNEKFLILKNKK